MILTAALIALACGVSETAVPTAPASRTVLFTYAVDVPAVEGDAPVELFLPIPVSDPHQDITALELASPVSGAFSTEARFGNRYWHATLPAQVLPTQVVLSFRATRRAKQVDLSLAGRRSLTKTERAEYARDLAPSARVPVGEIEVLGPLLTDVRAARTDDSPGATSRAIYDWVSTNMEYKKTGTGWGNGDTFWACSQRYGNCTDFHSVFLSLARTEGIPARFEMGFPVPLDRNEGTIAGYHCWVQFWLPDAGWIPIDASEAAKHPDRIDAFYGSQPADRVRFTTGRDLRLGELHRGPALNYFIYPYAERDGVPWTVKLVTAVSYRAANL